MVKQRATQPKALVATVTCVCAVKMTAVGQQGGPFFDA
jgi:hypothetical protein